MATYITLFSHTERGIRNIKDAPQRVQAARKAVESASGRWLEYHLTMGQNDGLAITEAPSDDA